MEWSERLVEVRSVTTGPDHHFFGYYDKFPWSGSGRYLLSLEVPFVGRQPLPSEPVVVGMTDLDTGEWIPLDETLAWNWQQGTMLQWMPQAPDRLIIYNVREADRFACVIRDVHTGETRRLPHPVYAVSHDGAWAVTPNFARLAVTRPGYGYDGLRDPFETQDAPEDDGIYRMDLATGQRDLIISLAQIAAMGRDATMEGVKHWFNHLQFCTDDSRFVFLHRWRHDKWWLTRMLTANPDGTGVHCVSDHRMVSHFDWRDADHILAWATRRDQGDHYFLFRDQTDESDLVGGDVLTVDGHCSYSPDRRWILTDTYPDGEHKRTLLLYEEATGRRIDIGRFYSPPTLEGPWRCDLHPRWSRDGRQVCIDSAHEQTRQVYVMDVGEIVRG